VCPIADRLVCPIADTPAAGAASAHRCEDGLEQKPYYYFDYFQPAMITVFILLTGARWALTLT